MPTTSDPHLDDGESTSKIKWKVKRKLRLYKRHVHRDFRIGVGGFHRLWGGSGVVSE